MRRRLPPFALVLAALVASAALAIALIGGSRTSGRPPTFGAGPSHACQTTRASARVTARSAIVIMATATAPVRVTEQATGTRGTVSVTRSAVSTARLRVSEPVQIEETAVVPAEACARGASGPAARTAALRRAYADALTQAHRRAAMAADQSLRRLVRSRYPAVLAQAQRRANAQAHQLALATASKLAVQAQAEAVRRAGA